MTRFRSHFTFANVVSVIALFVALGGSSYAAVKINGKEIKTKSITGSKLKSDTLTGKQIKESTLATVPNATNATNASNLLGFNPSSFAPASAVFSSSVNAGVTNPVILDDPSTGLKVVGNTNAINTKFVNTSSSEMEIVVHASYNASDETLFIDYLAAGASTVHILEATGTQQFEVTAFNVATGKLLHANCMYADFGPGSVRWGCIGTRTA